MLRQFVMRPSLEQGNTETVATSPPGPEGLSDLGGLSGLVGEWKGHGFNVIWRPSQASKHFLELNLTTETLKFERVDGAIPNRGLLQPDLTMAGINYLQQISDSNTKSGLHFEPGIFLNVPETSEPNVPPTICRMGSIPHGTTFLAQGLASPKTAGPPNIQPTDINITPFPVGTPTNSHGAVQDPGNLSPAFANDMDLSSQVHNRSSGDAIKGITQQMVSAPSTVLLNTLSNQIVLDHTTLFMSSNHTLPVVGGGVSNIAFLEGVGGNPNADAAQVFSTFWIETIKGEEGKPNFQQLQYSQLVFLNFSNLTWPHITVATLTRTDGK